MLTWIREKFGTAMIGSLITFIAFVFIFYGFFSPKATRGLHEAAVAGTVNGDAITVAEFHRELNRRIEYLRNLGGSHLTDEQLKRFRLREAVFQDLVQRKVALQQARQQNRMVADEAVRDQIQEISAFHKEGRFDWLTYQRVLEANQYTPSSFERMMREDLSVQQWTRYYRDRVYVSDAELKKDFLIQQDQRKVKYVVWSPSVAQQYGPWQGKKNQAESSLEKTEPQPEELRDWNLKKADRTLYLMRQKNSEAALKQFLKSYQLQVQITPWVNRRNFSLSGVEPNALLRKNVFSMNQKNQEPQVYEIGNHFVVAQVVDVQEPQASQWEQQRLNGFKPALVKKAFALQEAQMSKWVRESQVERNASVVSSESL